MNLTRIQTGMPQAHPPAHAPAPRRRRNPHVAYTQGSYLPRDSRVGQPVFRIS